MDNWTVSDVNGHAGVIGQLFQINQSEDSSKITIKFNNTCVQLHQRCSITTAPTLVLSIRHVSIFGVLGGVLEHHQIEETQETVSKF